MQRVLPVQDQQADEGWCLLQRELQLIVSEHLQEGISVKMHGHKIGTFVILKHTYKLIDE
jgi:hypothetical protein